MLCVTLFSSLVCSKRQYLECSIPVQHVLIGCYLPAVRALPLLHLLSACWGQAAVPLAPQGICSTSTPFRLHHNPAECKHGVTFHGISSRHEPVPFFLSVLFQTCPVGFPARPGAGPQRGLSQGAEPEPCCSSSHALSSSRFINFLWKDLSVIKIPAFSVHGLANGEGISKVFLQVGSHVVAVSHS